MTDSFEGDYRALTAERGLVPLVGWSTLRVSGDDRLTFLNNFATNDVKSLPIGGGCESFFCDVKGKILAHAAVLVMKDAALIVGVAGTSERLQAHLDRYIIRENVELTDESGARSWALLAGQDVQTDERLAGEPSLQADWWHRDVMADGNSTASPLRVVACPWPWSSGFLVAYPPASFDKVAAATGARLCSAAAFDALRIESAWPLFGVDFDGANLPQEVNRDAQAISFKKGCYLGQETVARIDALGHVNKKLTLMKVAAGSPTEIPAELARGAAVFAGENQQAGVLTSVAWSPQFNAPIAMAMLRSGFNERGTRVSCGAMSGELVAPIGPTKLGRG